MLELAMVPHAQDCRKSVTLRINENRHQTLRAVEKIQDVARAFLLPAL